MWNIVGRRYWYFAFSLLVTVPGLIALLIGLLGGGLPLGIDFTGGSLLKIRLPGLSCRWAWPWMATR